jgi:hypothetical protein
VPPFPAIAPNHPGPAFRRTAHASFHPEFTNPCFRFFVSCYRPPDIARPLRCFFEVPPHDASLLISSMPPAWERQTKGAHDPADIGCQNSRPQRVSQDRELGAAQNFAVLVQQHTQPVRRAWVFSGESKAMSPGQTRRNAFPFRYFENDFHTPAPRCGISLPPYYRSERAVSPSFRD